MLISPTRNTDPRDHPPIPLKQRKEGTTICHPVQSSHFSLLLQTLSLSEKHGEGLTGASLEVLVDEEAFGALADKGFLCVQTQLLTAMVLLCAVIHPCICHTKEIKLPEGAIPTSNSSNGA